MSPSQYQQVAELVSRIRNARFGQMVTYVERLIESDAWRDFTTPAGTRFVFRPMEFDYFLAAQEVDPTVVRYAYLKAEDVDDLVTKQFRLADITGRGTRPANGDRRSPDEVVRTYESDPSGAGARIRAWREANTAVVTDAVSRAARHPERRKALEAGQVTSHRPRRSWRVEWQDDRTLAEAIADKLLRDPELSSAVLIRLRAASDHDSRRVPHASHSGPAST